MCPYVFIATVQLQLAVSKENLMYLLHLSKGDISYFFTYVTTCILKSKSFNIKLLLNLVETLYYFFLSHKHPTNHANQNYWFGLTTMF